MSCDVQGLHPDRNTVDIFSLAWPEICRDLGMPESPAPTEAYVQSVSGWQPFPDSVEALAYLKQHFLLFPITTGAALVSAHMADAAGTSTQGAESLHAPTTQVPWHWSENSRF